MWAQSRYSHLSWSRLLSGCLVLCVVFLSSGCGVMDSTVTVRIEPKTLQELKRLNDNVEALKSEMSHLSATMNEAAKLAFPDEYEPDRAGR